MQQFNRKAGLVIAVQLAFTQAPVTYNAPDKPLFYYQKWGGEQAAKVGDWVVKNGDSTYTVDKDSFAATYAEQSPGLYKKVVPVWAAQANKAGKLQTKEGFDDYEAGDFLVYNKREIDSAGNPYYSDGYVIKPMRFVELYEVA